MDGMNEPFWKTKHDPYFNKEFREEIKWRWDAEAILKKPFWETKYIWWVSDFKYRLRELSIFLELLRKHPDDEMGSVFRSLVKTVQNDLARLQTAYVKIYGTKMSIRVLKKEMGL